MSYKITVEPKPVAPKQTPKVRDFIKFNTSNNIYIVMDPSEGAKALNFKFDPEVLYMFNMKTGQINWDFITNIKNNYTIVTPKNGELVFVEE